MHIGLRFDGNGPTKISKPELLHKGGQHDVKIYSQSLTLIFCSVHDYVTVFGRKYASSQILVNEMLRINVGINWVCQIQQYFILFCHLNTSLNYEFQIRKFLCSSVANKL